MNCGGQGGRWKREEEKSGRLPEGGIMVNR